MCFDLIGAGIQAKAQVDQAKTVRQVADFNANVRDEEAKILGFEMKEAVRRRRKQNESLRSTQRAGFAKSGVIEEGTPVQVMAETAGLQELEILDIQHQTALEQERQKVLAEQERESGQAQAKGLKRRAVGTILSGIGDELSNAASAGLGG